jgi:hypothetical protein
MCLACQMEDELWLAYLDQVAKQAPPPEKAAAGAAEAAPAEDRKSGSPFACEELPPE